MQILPLPFNQWRQVWKLMLQENFPHTPTREWEAQAAFANVHMYGAWVGGELALAVIIGQTEPEQLGSHYIDVVCQKKHRGKWASRRLLQHIKHLLFTIHHAEVVIAETHNTPACKAAIVGGFQLVQAHKAYAVLMLKSSNLQK